MLVIQHKLKTCMHEQLFLSWDSSVRQLIIHTVDLLDQSLFAVKQDLYAIANMSVKRWSQLTVFQMQGRVSINDLYYSSPPLSGTEHSLLIQPDG